MGVEVTGWASIILRFLTLSEDNILVLVNIILGVRSTAAVRVRRSSRIFPNFVLEA